jgi:hypothetical protein
MKRAPFCLQLPPPEGSTTSEFRSDPRSHAGGPYALPKPELSRRTNHTNAHSQNGKLENKSRIRVTSFVAKDMSVK